MRPLVILRPQPGAGASAERARGMGLEVIVIPLFEVRPLPWTAPDPRDFDALVMTSANAARHGGPALDKLKGLPVHAIGEATAAAARGTGFQIATIGAGGAGQMNLPPGRRLLHLAGLRRRAVEGATSIIVYESAELPPPDRLKSLRDAVIAVHSPRAGRRLAELAGDRSRLAIAAISAVAAEACGSGWRSVAVAAAPSDAALLALAAKLCKELDE